MLILYILDMLSSPNASEEVSVVDRSSGLADALLFCESHPTHFDWFHCPGPQESPPLLFSTASAIPLYRDTEKEVREERRVLREPSGNQRTPQILPAAHHQVSDDRQA